MTGTTSTADGDSVAQVTFRATVELAMKTATGICVPDEVVAELGSGKRPPVVVTINGGTYRSTIAVMGGRFMLPLSAENRAIIGVAAGDEVEIRLALDAASRTVAVPADLAGALAAEPQVQAFFEGLAPSHRKAYVTSVESAKTAATRQRRVDKAMQMMRDGKRS